MKCLCKYLKRKLRNIYFNQSDTIYNLLYICIYILYKLYDGITVKLYTLLNFDDNEKFNVLSTYYLTVFHKIYYHLHGFTSSFSFLTDQI